MTTTIVIILTDVADTIERLRKDERDNAYITELALRTGGGLPLDSQVLRSIPFNTLLAALVNGYEREMTEEERKHARIRDAYVHWAGGDFSDGIYFALNVLGIQIEGVNA